MGLSAEMVLRDVESRLKIELGLNSSLTLLLQLQKWPSSNSQQKGDKDSLDAKYPAADINSMTRCCFVQELNFVCNPSVGAWYQYVSVVSVMSLS